MELLLCGPGPVLSRIVAQRADTGKNVLQINPIGAQ
jgi:hypothetical protein